MHGFDPFPDYEKLSPEMAEDLRNAAVRFYSVRDAMIRNPATVGRAADLIESTYRLDRVIDEIRQAIWTLPVLVHVAGERHTELCPECNEDELVVQRCKRCGSKLNQWQEHQLVFTPTGPAELDEDDIPWWAEDTIVAKGNNQGMVTMYEVEPDRDLAKHERKCVALNDLVATE